MTKFWTSLHHTTTSLVMRSDKKKRPRCHISDLHMTIKDTRAIPRLHLIIHKFIKWNNPQRVSALSLDCIPPAHFSGSQVAPDGTDSTAVQVLLEWLSLSPPPAIFVHPNSQRWFRSYELLHSCANCVTIHNHAHPCAVSWQESCCWHTSPLVHSSARRDSCNPHCETRLPVTCFLPSPFPFADKSTTACLRRSRLSSLSPTSIPHSWINEPTSASCTCRH
jgi:hypothetical protein